MTWTYGADPLNSTLDQVRLLIGDTDTSDQQLQDSEIQFEMTQASVPYYAAANCADRLAAKYARQVQRQFGRTGFRAFYNQKIGQYEQLAAALRRRAASGALPYAGGISRSDKATDETNTDAVQPFFSRTRGDALIVPEGLANGEDDDDMALYDDEMDG